MFYQTATINAVTAGYTFVHLEVKVDILTSSR